MKIRHDLSDFRQIYGRLKLTTRPCEDLSPLSRVSKMEDRSGTERANTSLATRKFHHLQLYITWIFQWLMAEFASPGHRLIDSPLRQGFCLRGGTFELIDLIECPRAPQLFFITIIHQKVTSYCLILFVCSWSPEAMLSQNMVDHQMSSDVIRCHQMSSDVIRCHQMSSEYHETSSIIIHYYHHHRQSSIINHHQSSSIIIVNHRQSSSIIVNHQHSQLLRPCRLMSRWRSKPTSKGTVRPSCLEATYMIELDKATRKIT